jgi:hypothetical protein
MRGTENNKEKRNEEEEEERNFGKWPERKNLSRKRVERKRIFLKRNMAQCFSPTFLLIWELSPHSLTHSRRGAGSLSLSLSLS